MKKIAIIGAGQMAEEYIKVLKELNIETICICRSDSSAHKLQKKYSINSFSGGVENNREVISMIDEAIVAVDLLNLENVASKLIEFKVKNILLEKPGSLTSQGIQRLFKMQNEYNSNVFIAYNRRFFQSVKKLKELILKDGGLTSISFNFTEWSDQVAKLNYEESILKKWLICNSSHVIDLFIFLAGNPKLFNSYTSGKLDWHDSGAIFSGNGITVNDIPFSYHSDWSSSGRWSIYAYTSKNKFILEPMEELKVVEKNSVAVKSINLKNAKIDQKFKPGIYFQTESFCKNNFNDLCDLNSHLKHMKFYEKIANYD